MCTVSINAMGRTVTCDNAGANTHTGPHAATITVSFMGRDWPVSRVQWRANDMTLHRPKTLQVGDTDL